MKVNPTEPTTSIKWKRVRNSVLIFGVAPLGSAVAVLLIGVYLSGQCVQLSKGDKSVVNSQFCQWISNLALEKQ